MTSGNDVDEPLAFDDADAVASAVLCDAILLHNRPIQRAVDDSVIIDAPGRSDFRAPRPRLRARADRAAAPCDAAPGLAVGAEMKCTVATCRDRPGGAEPASGESHASRAFEAFKRAIADLVNCFQSRRNGSRTICIRPISARNTPGNLRLNYDVPLVGVQHHHAHAAAVLAEHGVTGTRAGGGLRRHRLRHRWNHLGRRIARRFADRFPPDRTPSPHASSRRRRLRQTTVAQRAGACFTRRSAPNSPTADLPRLAEPEKLEFVRRCCLNGVSCVQSSSTGRLFDGSPRCWDLCRENRFDAEAPMALEAAAAQSADSVGDCRGLQFEKRMA
jgi:hydrogenase maturation protein HypF